MCKVTSLISDSHVPRFFLYSGQDLNLNTRSGNQTWISVTSDTFACFLVVQEKR